MRFGEKSWRFDLRAGLNLQSKIVNSSPVSVRSKRNAKTIEGWRVNKCFRLQELRI